MATLKELVRFKKIISDYYKKNRRSFPWRETRDPYKILVSEVMLQQTQAPRVVEKYLSFLKRFPTVAALAKAPTAAVLKEWQGLGYNRRGLALKKMAEAVIADFKGKIPKHYDQLVTLPGVGPATAGDVLAFAWNIPTAVIETNIRTVFIHFFFKDQDAVSDRSLLPLIESTLDRKNPRDWYYALMDYGAMLKKTIPNPSRRSRHHTRQSPFKGSNREIRSKILKYILAYPKQSLETILEALPIEAKLLEKNLEAMIREGLISKKNLKGKTIFFS